MNTLRKISIVILFPALAVMCSFFLMVAKVEVTPTFLQKTFIVGAVLAILTIVALVKAKAPNSAPPRIRYNRPEPRPTKEPEQEEWKFHEIKGTPWTKNFVSEPGPLGEVLAMFVRKTDSETRILEQTNENSYVVYRVGEDNSWTPIETLTQEQTHEYIEHWARGADV